MEKTVRATSCAMCAAAVFLLFFINISRGQDVFHAFHSAPVLYDALCDINVLDNISSVSLISCMTHCSSNGQCVSFSFSKSERLCWLHNILVSDEAPGQTRNGTRCYNMMHDECDASDGYSYEPILNFCFKIYDIVTDYNTAESKCHEDRAYLLRLDEFSLMDYLCTLLTQKQYFVQSNYNTAVSEWQFDDWTHIEMTELLTPIAKDNPTADSKLMLDKLYTYFWTHKHAQSARFICQKFVKVEFGHVKATTPTLNLAVL